MVSVVIVTHNNAAMLKSCIESLQKQKFTDIEVTVVFNASLMSTIRETKCGFPWVNSLINEENLLFSKAYNQGILVSRGEFIFCLNDDVILEPNSIKELVKIMSQEERIGMISGKILRMDKVTVDSTGLSLSFWRTAIERGYGQKDVGQFEDPDLIFGVNGAAAFYRRKMLDEIKQGQDYFDTDFGFFYEDLDMAWRAQKKGWKAYYVPTAIAYHARGGTARKKEGVGRSFARFYISNDLQFELIKNRYLTIIKSDTVLGLLLHLPFIFIYGLAELGFLLLFRPKVIPMLLYLPRFIKLAFRKRFAAKRV